MKTFGARPQGERLERIQESPLWVGRAISQPAPDAHRACAT